MCSGNLTHQRPKSAHAENLSCDDPSETRRNPPLRLSQISYAVTTRLLHRGKAGDQTNGPRCSTCRRRKSVPESVLVVRVVDFGLDQRSAAGTYCAGRDRR